MTLFHYCSAAAFDSILRNRSIWLSSLSASNDTQEGKWLSVVMKNAIETVAPNAVFAPWLLSQMEAIESSMDCLGFCLSSEGDMLSQWRGYANDGRGFSIGFNREIFNQIANTRLQATGDMVQDIPALNKVVYSEEEQIELLKPRLDSILTIAEGAYTVPTVLGSSSDSDYKFRASRQRQLANMMLTKLIFLRDIMYVTKNPAFREELEWRFTMEISRGYVRCNFRTRGDVIVPYEELNFPPSFDRPIDCIIIGPRNPTPEAVVRAYLDKHGYNYCEIKASTATYRSGL